MTGSANLRIGIDTGGTFTDIVCVDDKSGAMRVTKVSSTPSNPAVALVRGVHAILGQWGADVDDLAVLAHGTTVATNALLQGEIAGLGLIVTDGFRHILEIARQAVPEGYGNSYFWVKPERLVPLDLVREVGGRLDFRGEELRPLAEADVRVMFLVDKSGSMQGAIEASKDALGKILAGFPVDRLHVAAFDTMGQVLKPKAASRAAVQHMLAPLQAAGGTIHGAGVRRCIAMACASPPARS